MLQGRHESKAVIFFERNCDESRKGEYITRETTKDLKPTRDKMRETTKKMHDENVHPSDINDIV